ncbi:MAG: FkbM family methyltransferase [Bdellovibrionota bacterium]
MEQCNSIIRYWLQLWILLNARSPEKSTKSIHCFDLSRTGFWALRKSFKKSGLKLPNIHKKLVGLGTESSEHISIDNFLETKHLDNPILMKIDIEGYECIVLDGMKTCLDNNDVHLLMEVHPSRISKIKPSGLEDFCSVLESTGYKLEVCKNHRGPHRGPDAEWEDCSFDELKKISKKLEATGDNFAAYFSKA